MFRISESKSPIIFAGLHERRAVQLYADAPDLGAPGGSTSQEHRHP
jgi:hypothetical protein